MNVSFFTHMILASIAASIFMLLILMIKKGLKNHISSRWQYNISLLYMILLAVPLFPANWLRAFSQGKWLGDSLMFKTAGFSAVEKTAREQIASSDMSWLQDFTISAQRLELGSVAMLFGILWIAGMMGATLFTYFCNRDLRLLRESAVLVQEGRLAVLFGGCKAELKIKQDILLGTSILAGSPMTIGFYRPQVILPAGLEQDLPAEDIRYILLHELTHCRNKDMIVNNMMCLFQIIYWYNPVIFFIFKEMRLERELACDISVLKHLPECQHFEYAKTLLRFVQKLSPSSALSLAMEMGGSRRQIKNRLESILAFTAESGHMKVKSIGAFLLAGMFMVSQIPLLSTFASLSEDKYDFHADNVIYEDMSSFFGEFDGSFVLYDMEASQYIIHNKDRSAKRVSPDSTYKIYSALIAMDKGIISMEHSERKWDGESYPFDSWNRNQNLKSAMQDSVSWYFQDIDRQVGMKELEAYYTRLPYGNHDLSGGIVDYWGESSLRISPIEQVELLTSFYKNETIFKSDHVDAVKSILHLSEKDGAVLSGKTGSGAVNGKGVNGWFIGYVEKGGRTVLFAANIQGQDHAAGSEAVQIALSILEEKSIY